MCYGKLPFIKFIERSIVLSRIRGSCVFIRWLSMKYDITIVSWYIRIRIAIYWFIINQLIKWYQINDFNRNKRFPMEIYINRLLFAYIRVHTRITHKHIYNAIDKYEWQIEIKKTTFNTRFHCSLSRNSNEHHKVCRKHRQIKYLSLRSYSSK